MAAPILQQGEPSLIDKAIKALEEQGIDPDQLSKQQMDTLTALDESNPPDSIESLLQSLNILTPDDLLSRCRTLLAELKLFANECEKKKFHREYRRPFIKYTSFQADVQGDAELMEKIKKTKTEPKRVQQLLHSSNFPFLEAIWATAKTCTEITALRSHGGRLNVIDIICSNGQKWIKVSTMPERRLLMDMAKQGWEWQGMSDSDSDEDERMDTGEVDLKDDEDDIPLVKMAKGLIKASKETRVRYRHPEVHFVLTRIHAGNKDIDAVLNRLRLFGCTVHTVETLPPTPSITSVVDKLVVDEFRSFTPMLNIDCTILLALVSDISHAKVKEEAWFNPDIRRQIKIEEETTLMTNILWPALIGHDLVCSALAAQRMREIVNLIGTPTEKARTDILMGDDSTLSPQQILQNFQELSIYPVPPTWRLPIRVHDGPTTSLPPLAQKVAEQLTDINQSVFLSGWAWGATTITSNRLVVKTIEKIVEENTTGDEDVDLGPDFWVCPTARSLVAKEKDAWANGGASKSTWNLAKKLASEEA